MQPLLHLLFPVGMLLLLGFERRTVFLLSPIALLPDFDVLFSLHRGLFHNLFFGVFVAGAAYLLAGRTRAVLLAASFLFASHLALDFGYIGSAYLYPFDPAVYGFDFRTLSWVTRTLAETQVPDVFLKVHPILFVGTAALSSSFFLHALRDLGLPRAYFPGTRFFAAKRAG